MSWGLSDEEIEKWERECKLDPAERIYFQRDDTAEAEGPPVYETGACAERHDAQMDALRMQLELTDRRLQEVERKLAAERRWVVALSQRVEALETLAEQWTAND